MARLFELDQTQADTNRIMGTYGYMAPEYAARGNFSLKSDVFSFGVLVLEIISGRRNLVRHSGENSEMLVVHVWKNWREGNISNIVDPAVSSGYSANILRCIHISLLCVQGNATNRPEMTSVVRWLDNHSVPLPVPNQPAFLTGMSSSNDIPSIFDNVSRTTESNTSQNNEGMVSINGASITQPYPRYRPNKENSMII
ncbi:hypothetical protein MLD38_001636 [Melastoma candidum]|uniref:Uncharacterized protein n=1 Tax=Melastoma candidum TaxID=119954 RepID=A0ACB9SMH2_9MYRT|nr:hypothetical protein MLD38_001636 [Melastoma candidum]